MLEIAERLEAVLGQSRGGQRQLELSAIAKRRYLANTSVAGVGVGTMSIDVKPASVSQAR
jgi:hypothetical protein